MAISRRLRVLAAGMVASGALLHASLAIGRSIPTPRMTIYPGDRIDDSLLEDIDTPLDDSLGRNVIESRSDLVGKVARRTLLPGQAIPAIAVDNPRLVAIGSQVRIVFSEGGLFITALGLALQAGSVGDLIRVRNQDSSLIVVGVVQPDGTVKVSEA
jgi:flagellar basal body P-ring formation protein FlgA